MLVFSGSYRVRPRRVTTEMICALNWVQFDQHRAAKSQPTGLCQQMCSIPVRTFSAGGRKQPPVSTETPFGSAPVLSRNRTPSTVPPGPSAHISSSLLGTASTACIMDLKCSFCGQ